MPLSPADLVSITEAASNLAERFSGKYLPDGDNNPEAERRRVRWRELVSGDDQKRFADVLKKLGLECFSQAELTAMFGRVKFPADGTLSRWALFLREISDTVSQSFTTGALDLKSQIPSRGKGRTLPFEHLYWPIAEVAWLKAATAQSVNSSIIGPAARRGFQRYLVQRISGIASQALYTSFLAHKAFAGSGMMQFFFRASPAMSATTDAERRHYASFVFEQGRDGLSVFFKHYPAAARLIAELTEQWVDFVTEVLDRLINDRQELAIRFNSGESLGRLVAVKAGLSDPHHGGQTVLVLNFASGVRLVYKPRPMAIDGTFFEFIAELNRRDSKLGHRVLKIYDRGRYGWMEFAQHARCTSKAQTKRYFRRAGSLVCLVDWLQGIDFHRENVVAAGEQPLLIDLECLAHPLRPGEMQTDASTERTLAGSVLRTGLLPLWQGRFADSTYYDNSGFGAPLNQRSIFPVTQWENVNTDHMQVIEKTVRRSHLAHRVRLRGRILPLTKFQRDFAAGVKQMATLLDGNHADLRVWMAKFFGTARRNIVRPTLIYGRVLQRSLHPKYLTAGIERSVELYALPADPIHSNAFLREIASLEKLDIPVFEITESVPTLVADQQAVRSATQAKLIRLSLSRRLRLIEGKVLAVVPPPKTGSPNKN